MLCKGDEGRTRRAGPCSEPQPGKIRFCLFSLDQLKVMQETSAKVSEGAKRGIKDIAQAEKTENGMEAVTELGKSLRNQDTEY